MPTSSPIEKPLQSLISDLSEAFFQTEDRQAQRSITNARNALLELLQQVRAQQLQSNRAALQNAGGALNDSIGRLREARTQIEGIVETFEAAERIVSDIDFVLRTAAKYS